MYVFIRLAFINKKIGIIKYINYQMHLFLIFTREIFRI